MRGTIAAGELWALLDGGSVPEPKGVQLKIIWRMTGNGGLRLSATNLDLTISATVAAEVADERR